MEQEHCPNCGTPGRPGAKYCAACGYEYASPGDAKGAVADGGPPVGPDSVVDQTIYATSGEDAMGWPSSGTPTEPFFASGWNQRPAAVSAAVSDSNNEPVAEEATLWQDLTARSWPAPPEQSSAGLEASLPSPHESRPEHAQFTELNQTESSALAHAAALLDELRRTIERLAQKPAIELNGVISDLEVAVTPPGAMPAEEVAELREALLAAREKPRDVDTIIDLTKRVEAMVSLAIAYDRAIAAIERSLDVLKNKSERESG